MVAPANIRSSQAGSLIGAATSNRVTSLLAKCREDGKHNAAQSLHQIYEIKLREALNLCKRQTVSLAVPKAFNEIVKLRGPAGPLSAIRIHLELY